MKEIPEGFILESVDSGVSKRFNLSTNVYNLKFNLSEISLVDMDDSLLEMFDNLANIAKAGLEPENDRISISIKHPDLHLKSIDVPFQRPKNLNGQQIFTRIGKILQSQETILLDTKLVLSVTVCKGINPLFTGDLCWGHQ